MLSPLTNLFARKTANDYRLMTNLIFAWEWTSSNLRIVYCCGNKQFDIPRVFLTVGFQSPEMARFEELLFLYIS
jgi:hypothetical protein